MSKKSSGIELLGATSLLAPHIIKRLILQGLNGCSYSRTNPPVEDHSDLFPWSHLDAGPPGKWKAEAGTVVIAILPIWLLAKLLPRLTACRQLITFSSTSVFTKTESSDPKEQALAMNLAEAEEKIKAYCRGNSIAWTILRPTLIYDPGKDANVSAIARFIKKWKFFPVAYPAGGLRQPVHADDLAAAAVAAIDNPQAFNQEFNLTGGETLRYRELVKRVFQAMGYLPFIVPLPTFALKAGLKCLSLIRNTEYSPELFTRMNQDLAFDPSPARKALDYNPRAFHPDFTKPT